LFAACTKRSTTTPNLLVAIDATDDTITDIEFLTRNIFLQEPPRR
jgi:hypothetical protein